MEKKVLNYRVIIEPEKMGKKTVYNAYCEALGLADYGDSIEEAIKSMRSLIKFHIECLIEEGKEVPQENIDKEFVTSAKVSIRGTGNHRQVFLE